LGEEEAPSEVLQCSDQEYCLDENCAGTIEYEANTSLPLVVTYLKSLEEIGKDMQQDPLDINIFTGKSNSCEKDIFGASNCCKNSGWGSGVGIGGCSYEEENLGLQKEEGYCVYVGSYCSEEEDLTGTCLKKAEGYCCFGSKLSRIIQQQGKPQIGVSFGSGESPQCRGFSVEEMQSLDFSQINFSEYTRELTLDMQEISKDDLESSIITTIGGIAE
jgi:conjugal transfer mating pair stabilization protein TraN